MKNESKGMPRETMQCKCTVCRKEFHVEEALFCTLCGTKLNLSKAERYCSNYSEERK